MAANWNGIFKPREENELDLIPGVQLATEALAFLHVVARVRILLRLALQSTPFVVEQLNVLIDFIRLNVGKSNKAPKMYRIAGEGLFSAQ